MVLMLTVINISIASSTKKEIQAIQDYSINMSLNNENFIAKEKDGTILAPIVYKDRTYLPVRQLAEVIGVSVDWDNNTKTVILHNETNTGATQHNALIEENNALKEQNESLKYEISQLNDEIEALKELTKQIDSGDGNHNSEVVLYWSNDNIRYKGSMLDNQYSGYGKAYNLDGTLQYDGEWKEGKYHGNGKSYYNGHLVFDGNWNNNEMCGYGIKHANPDKKYDWTYEGEWENNQLNGLGKKYNKDGQLLYIGNWKDGKQHGFGVSYNKDIMIYIGWFKERSRHGWGLFFDNDGDFEYEAMSEEGRIIEVLSKNLRQVNIPSQVPIEVISGQGDTEIQYQTDYIKNNNWYIDGEGNEIYKETL